jgi:VanZ family protein
VACLVSGDNFNELEKVKIPAKDKFLHGVFYFVFTILWSFGLRTLKVSDARKRRMWAFAIAVGYGILMEICQLTMTDSRSADVLDAVANSIGSTIAVLVLWRFQKRKLNKRSPAY